MALFPCTVWKTEEIAKGKFVLQMEKPFSFTAGQVLALALDDSHEPRIYSICSGESDPFLQILFDVNKAGTVTPRLSKMRKGDLLYVSKPYGRFLPDRHSPMWWIATGTGIAPFYAMLRTGYQPVKLLHGARESTHFHFEQEFLSRLGEHYVRCNSGMEEAGDFQGRVNHFLERLHDVPLDNKYYLCGRSLMVVEVRDLLIARGVPYENIVTEIYF